MTEELLIFFDLNNQLKTLTDRSDTFTNKYDGLNSELLVKKNRITLLHQRFVYLEWNAVNKALCYRRVFLVAKSVSRDIRDNAVEETVFKTLSVAGHEATPGNLYGCHQLKN